VPLDQVTDACDRPGESPCPLCPVDMVDEADDRPRAPQRREVGNAVLHVDEHVGVGGASAICERREEVLGVIASAANDVVGARPACPSAGDEHNVVTTLDRSSGEPVDNHLGATRMRMRKVAP
jgi:hypothetical protein